MIKKIVLTTIASAMLFGCSQNESQKTTLEHIPSKYASDNDWQLVWHDEFNYQGLPDKSKWTYEQGMVRNNEAQYYTVDRLKNARVEQGNLIIQAHKEKYKNAEYSSASLTTKGIQDWTYGRIEVKAKVPTGTGTWAAIWMLGSNFPETPWPLCGEIDLMENVGFDPNVVHGNIHTEKFNHAMGTNKGNGIQLAQPYNEYHVYAVEWFEDRIDFYVDDNKHFTFENDGQDVESWPFDKPQYLILNLAIGGSWGGEHGIDDSIFPQKLEIDYVRVYQ